MLTIEPDLHTRRFLAPYVELSDDDACEQLERAFSEASRRAQDGVA